MRDLTVNRRSADMRAYSKVLIGLAAGRRLFPPSRYDHHLFHDGRPSHLEIEHAKRRIIGAVFIAFFFAQSRWGVSTIRRRAGLGFSSIEEWVSE